MINPSQHKPTGMPSPAAPKLDPEDKRRMDWVQKVRGLHRTKRMLGFAGIVLGAALVVWARMSPDAPPWALMTGFGVLAVSWLVFIYVIYDRWRWVKKNPYKPAPPPSSPSH
ncbi:MAG: hypothetical protein Q8R02_13645 [Hyphomonadaceae bacterium]|nr:hypothetical protein [Hyphomonadaceae bacterium]